MFALWLTTAISLLAIAASTPMSYHALTDEATGSVLIFPASRPAQPSMGDLRGLPIEAVKKDDGTKGFLSSWFKPESRPVAWQAPAPYQGQHDHYDPYYQTGSYPISGYPSGYPGSQSYPTRYPAPAPASQSYPDKTSKWQELVDKFYGFYNDKNDKLQGLYYDKYDKFQNMNYDKFNKFQNMNYDKFNKFQNMNNDKYGSYQHAHPPGYYGNGNNNYNDYHNNYQGLGWGSGGYHRYPNSDRPYEYGFEGGPYEG